MLNLIQLQERLKDMPMQAVMQYANGANPQVPPFLALTELNRRKRMQESAAAEQAQQMEGAPTIKDQIEQAAGQIALQGSRQRQAAQQQAGVSANTPMAAPNTTTSEPAQLAGGGFIDDMVVPRDYQGGGIVNPAMMQQLARARAMRRPRGLAGVPIPKDMFRRADYAGGGIVAFEAGGAVKRVSGKTLSEYMASVADALKGNSIMTEQEKIDALNRARIQFLNSPADPGSGGPEAPSKPAAGPSGLESLFTRQQQPGSTIGTAALSRALKIDPSKYFPTEQPRSVEELMNEAKRLQGIAGVSEEFLNRRDQRLAELQAKREEARAEHPMDQLKAFLTGTTEKRGGNWATQGAQGVKSSMALRAQQEALRDKQDADMEELKFASEAKRDAIRRGDLKDAQAQKIKEDDIRRDMMKNQADFIRGQAQLETSGRQAELYGQQVGRLNTDERIQQLYMLDARQKGETPTVEGYLKFRDRHQYGGKPSMIMTPEDAIRIATQQIKAEGGTASRAEIEARARELLEANRALGGISSSPSAAPVSPGNRPPITQFQK